MKRVRPVLLCALALLPRAVPVAAQDVSVRSYLDRTQIGVNQQFLLSVEVSGSQQLTGNPALPDVSAFARVLGSSTSQQMQVVNGRRSVSLRIDYRLQATQLGQFEIGGMVVTVAGRAYRTDPVTVTIVQSATPPSGGGNAGRAGGAPVAGEELFLRATVDKRQVYQNEPVIVEYKIYTLVQVDSYSVLDQPGTAGFWAEEYPLQGSPQTSAEVLNGRRYTVATLKKTALFPTGAGVRTIEPLSIEAQVRVRGRDGFFGGSLFARRAPAVIASDPIDIDVMPLPSEGRPAEFTGHVGTLRISASVDKLQVATNEAVSLQIRIDGEGNIRTLPTPDIDFPLDFEVYPPEEGESINRGEAAITGSKTYEYVLIPRAPGTKTIPPITLNFFDRGRGVYASVGTDPIVIEVTGEALPGPVVAGGRRGEIRTLREDIRYIHLESPSFQPLDGSPLSNVGFWTIVLLPLVTVGGAWVARRHQDRMLGDVAFARRRRAGRVAKKRLAVARSLSGSDTPKEFYAEAGKALQGFLGDKLNMAEAGMVRDDVRDQFTRRGVTAAVADAYLECLDTCDRKRFSPAGADTAEMKAFVERAAHVMADLDRGLAR